MGNVIIGHIFAKVAKLHFPRQRCFEVHIYFRIAKCPEYDVAKFEFLAKT